MGENLYSGEDSQVARDNLTEKNRLVWTKVIIKRFQTFTGGNTQDGQSPARNVFYFTSMGKLRNMTGKDIVASNGIYALGDVEFTSKSPIYGPNNRPATITQADQLTWQGLTYTLVGNPYPVMAQGGRAEWKSVWRRSS